MFTVGEGQPTKTGMTEDNPFSGLKDDAISFHRRPACRGSGRVSMSPWASGIRCPASLALLFAFRSGLLGSLYHSVFQEFVRLRLLLSRLSDGVPVLAGIHCALLPVVRVGCVALPCTDSAEDYLFLLRQMDMRLHTVCSPPCCMALVLLRPVLGIFPPAFHSFA